MTTLAEHIIMAGTENPHPMLEKLMYDSWASRIRLFIKGKKHGRMMLDSINNGSLVYLTIEEDGQTRPKKYSKLTEAQQLQDNCDVQATSIILHGFPPDVYALQGEDPIDCINKAMTFLSDVASSSTNSRKKTQSFAEEGHMARQCTQPKRPRSATWFKEKLMLAKAQEAGQILDEEKLAFLVDPRIEEAPIAQQIIPHNSAFQTEDLDVYDLDCDDLSSAKAVLMENLSSCDSNVLSEVPYSNSYLKDMINWDVKEMSYS
uniref:Integrase, catalytic region, zinc finger, CCHC-type, peptidase aspartic, catalytic n=1 Tax=Tanacetum cinerariifolium TaxID=118510 RepID=A0A6L2K0H3_TANCI|nr:hypothetical protein [Tanacetum cinerariifolium]